MRHVYFSAENVEAPSKAPTLEAPSTPGLAKRPRAVILPSDVYFRHGKYSSSSDLNGFRQQQQQQPGVRLFGGRVVANSDVRSSSVDVGKVADYFLSSAKDISASSDSAMGGSIATASSVANSPLLLRSHFVECGPIGFYNGNCLIDVCTNIYIYIKQDT